MTVDSWLEHAVADAERRGLSALRPLLEALARSTSALRGADWTGADGNDAWRTDEATGGRRASTSIHER